MRRSVYWSCVRAGRLVVVLFAIVVCFLLLSVDALRFFQRHVTDFSSLLLPWARFGFSALVALLFLAIGSLIWLYARNRRVALLLFSFSFTMMVAFAVQTSAASNDPLLSAIATSSIALSLPLFSTLLLLFPKDYLSPRLQSSYGSEESPLSGRRDYTLLLRGYLIVLALLSLVVAVYSTIHYLLPRHLPHWLDTLDNGYYVLVLTGILIIVIVSYRQSSSLRERQQRRIFVSGVILSFAPVLLLTVLPLLLDLPLQYVVDGQLSALTLVLLPIAIGYSILRYQILVFDKYIRRAVAWMFGSVGLAVASYLVIVLSSVLLSGAVSVSVIVAALVMAMVAPGVWWVAQLVTERLFFSESLHYRRLVDRPELLSSETLDLDEASQLLVQAAVMAFVTQEVCLLVLDDDTGYYRPYPELKDDDPRVAPRHQLVQHLLRVVKPSASVHSDWIDADEPMLERIASARRPLLLSEASRTDEDGSPALARYIATTSPLEGPDPLLAPVRTQGKMIGILVLGERGDRQQYAGPDFEAIHLILTRFSPVLETSRLYAQKSRHAAILNALYSANTLSVKTFQTIEEVAVAYAKVAADAVMAGAGIWLYDEKEQLLRHVIFTGSGPQLTSLETLKPSEESDWTSWFCEGGSADSWTGPSSNVPSCLPQTPCFPFAWIPLKRGQEFLGMLVLTYPRPHVFSPEEKRVLEMFANQCATALENAQFTLALRIAHERQKELDRLKDQFIVMASHELRTPLTAVQGYIELLHEHGQELPPEVCTAFISKARRGCNELTLMVENIMDASRVQIDAEKVQLSEVPLAEAIEHVVEILEAVVEREKRSIRVDVPTDLLVMANDLRLRQVLLNLVSNAIKYSPAGANVDITCDQNDERVTVRIHDRGPGVPLEYQTYLFERFVRLERDVNSPVRGAGLGLYISKQLIEAMGGSIWVESTGIPGEGSVFAFTLNLPKVEVSQKVDEIVLQHQTIS